MSKWENVRIGDFLYHREGTYKPDNPKVRDLTRLEKIDFGGNIHLAKKKSKTNMIIIKPGDLVISGINVSKGAVAIYQGSEDISATIHFSSYKFDKEKIDIDFFKLFLKSSSFIELLKEQVKAGIKTEIKPKHILPLIIHLPDKKEQTIIVNWFNKKLKKIYKLQDEINYQELLLKHFHQSILQEAIEGKLTADWRKEHPELIIGENSAESLLKKIKEEKEHLIRENKIKKQKSFPPIAEKEKPFGLPEGWSFSRIGDLGLINPRNYLSDELKVSFVPMNLISEGYGVRPSFLEKKWNEIKIGYTHFQDGDIALAKITPCFENSKCCIFRSLINGYGAGTTELHVLRPITGIVNSEYIYLFLKTASFLKKGEKLMKGTAGQKRVPLNYFEEGIIPIPPNHEQVIIINRINHMLNKINILEKQINNQERLSEQLTQSLLREAFEQSN